MGMASGVTSRGAVTMSAGRDAGPASARRGPAHDAQSQANKWIKAMEGTRSASHQAHGWRPTCELCECSLASPVLLENVERTTFPGACAAEMGTCFPLCNLRTIVGR
jgi:hypothetical protein